MSEDGIIYPGEKPGSELEVDYYRRRLRQLAEWLKDIEMRGADKISVRNCVDLVNALLVRPRSNGAIVDDLERKVAELRAQVLHAKVLQIEYEEIRQLMEAMSRELDSLRRKAAVLDGGAGGPFERAVQRFVMAPAVRIDRFVEGWASSRGANAAMYAAFKHMEKGTGWQRKQDRSQ